MTKNGQQLENWEVSLIRKMLNSGIFTKQQILAFFSQPRRSINQARISEIATGHERYEGIREATNEELETYLQEWEHIKFPGPPLNMETTQHILSFPDRIIDLEDNEGLLSEIIEEYE